MSDSIKGPTSKAAVSPHQTESSSSTLDRRRLMVGLAGLSSAAWLPRKSAAEQATTHPGKVEPLTVPPWTLEQGRTAGRPYGTPSRFEDGVHRILAGPPLTPYPTHGSAESLTPLQHMHGIITPNGLFYERHHGGVPDVDPEQHRLVIHGLVERDVLFTVNDLLRMPSVSRIHFLECSGNGADEWPGPTGRTVQETHGLLSCCQWTGVSLRTLLAESGLRTSAKWLIAEGADAAAMSRSIPISIALDDCMVAYAQNGERLRPEQGFPLRLLVPGCEGNMNIKWLRRIEVSDVPFHTREETSKYTDLLPSGKAREFTFIMEAKSVITSPSGGQKLTDRGFVEIRGLAWSGRGVIRRVDVSVDGGRNWRTAALDPPVLPKCLTSFRLPWEWDGRPAVIMSRAIDETGYVQPFRRQLQEARGLASVYHFNALQPWGIGRDGEVRNVEA